MSATSTPVRIGDGKGWQFINGDWNDGENGLVSVPEDLFRTGDSGMQTMHWAFSRELCYGDCTVRFEINIKGHTDAGIILRAKDASHFYLVHFPYCAQACRAQHFWGALSKMDDSGYLKHIKLEMMRRVPSQINIWLPVEVTVKGSRFIVRVGDYGYMEAEDSTYTAPGCIGFHTMLNGQIRNVSVEGQPDVSAWKDGVEQPVNWHCPIHMSGDVWQQPTDLKRFSDGELLLLFGVQGDKLASADAVSIPHLSRSADGGKTWSDPKPLDVGDGSSVTSWAGYRIHITPQGRLVAYMPALDHKLLYESGDRGRTWSGPVKANLHLGPPHEKPVQQVSPQGFLNLQDGGILALMLMVYPLKDPSLNVWTWGSYHIQAYTSRSDDDGLTWTEPVNIDTPGYDDNGNKYEGNLDLTEASAVQLPGGRIMAFIRPIYSPWMWETWSDDGGRSWGPCVRGPFPGYAAPNIVRTSSGALVMAHRMPGLNANLSLDDGKTWDHGVTIDSGVWAMGGMVEVEPDVVLYVYWDTLAGLMRAQ